MTKIPGVLSRLIKNQTAINAANNPARRVFLKRNFTSILAVALYGCGGGGGSDSRTSINSGISSAGLAEPVSQSIVIHPEDLSENITTVDSTVITTDSVQYTVDNT